MDLTYAEEQGLLRNMALDFLRTELPKDRVLDIDASPEGFSPELWQKMVDLGWAGMGIPEAFGGGGIGLVELGAFAEALGEAACPSPFLTNTLSAHILLQAGNEAQKRQWLGAMAARGQIVTSAITEPEYGWRADDVQLRATRDGSGFVLNGAKLFVPDAQIADALIVAARTAWGGNADEGITLFLIDPRREGVGIRRLTGWMSENLCEVTLSNVAVAADEVIGEVGKAWPALSRAIDRATAVACAYMAGGARRATEMAIEYSKSRIVFGVAIGTFQRVQDHIVIALNDADACRWSAYEALWKLENERSDASLAVSLAKSVASTGFYRACQESHQVHAGVGTDVSLGLAHYTRRARTLQHYLGDAVHHKRRMAQLLALDVPGENVRTEGAFARAT